MSTLPPNIDAILASIRARINDDAAAPAAPPPAPEPVAAPPPVADIGAVSLAGGETTIDALVRSLLEPMLKDWLDANLPEIVEKVARGEIKRLTGRE